jgi:hypothetical protein
MSRLHPPIAAVAIVALTACFPAVTEMRMAFLPARASDCAIAWLPRTPSHAKSPVGVVTLYRGVPAGDPLAAPVRAVVGPRACAMGGQTVAFVTASTMDGLPVSATYVVYGDAPEGASPYIQYRDAPEGAPLY